MMSIQGHMDDIKLVSWTLTAAVVVVLITRQIAKTIVFRKVGLDDSFILIGSIFAISLSATVLILTANGRAISFSLASSQADILSKGYYTSELFYVSGVCFPKLSILVLFCNIVASRQLLRCIVLGLCIFISTWTLISLITIAFQCELPHPWKTTSPHCLSFHIFWVIYCAFDVLTEIALVTIPMNIVASLQIPLCRKMAVVSCFSPRLLVVAGTIVRTIWVYPTIPQRHDHHQIWEPLVAMQVQLCMSIITASIPFMVPYCRELSHKLQGSTPTRSSMHPQDKRVGHPTPIWFRRHLNNRDAVMRNSDFESAVHYELVPRVSPGVPFARSTSPVASGTLKMSPKQKSSIKGLNIRIPRCSSPGRRGHELVSPRTQSSGMLSPWSTSPQALLTHSFVPSRKAPIPPPKTPRSGSLTQTSFYSDDPDTPPSTASRSERSLLSRHEQSRATFTSPQASLYPSPGTLVASDKRSVIRHNTTPPKRLLCSHPSPRIKLPRSSSSPRLQNPQFSTLNQSNVRQRSIEDLVSPMGTAISGWFNSPDSDRPHQPSPSSPSRARDSPSEHAFSPVESPYVPTYPLFSHTRSLARRNDFFNEPSLSHSFYYASLAPETRRMPSVRDARSSPRVVVRNVM